MSVTSAVMRKPERPLMGSIVGHAPEETPGRSVKFLCDLESQETYRKIRLSPLDCLSSTLRRWAGSVCNGRIRDNGKDQAETGGPPRR